MIKLSHILLPIDFSDHCNRATEYACELARQFGAELTLSHAVESPVVMMPSPGAPIPDSLVEDQENTARSNLRSWLPAEPKHGFRICREIRRGTPFVQIVRFAKENDVDLIVLSTHGRSGLSHLLTGSVAERVVRKAPCPVLTVRPEGHQFVMP